jgi:CTP:molybdopterin cytidylyltransferase MocA
VTSPAGTTLGVLLAAGEGRRFAGPVHKLRADLAGKPVVAHSLDALLGSGIGACAVVTGAVPLGDLLHGATEIANPSWRTGQRSSVLAAIAHARALGMESVVFALGDQPFLTSEAWRMVAHDDSPLAVATYDGVRAHPVRMHRSLWDEFETLTPGPDGADAGVRTLMRLHPELVHEVACKGNPADIDTPEDLARWT